MIQCISNGHLICLNIFFLIHCELHNTIRVFLLVYHSLESKNKFFHSFVLGQKLIVACSLIGGWSGNAVLPGITAGNAENISK